MVRWTLYYKNRMTSGLGSPSLNCSCFPQRPETFHLEFEIPPGTCAEVPVAWAGLADARKVDSGVCSWACNPGLSLITDVKVRASVSPTNGDLPRTFAGYHDPWPLGHDK